MSLPNELNPPNYEEIRQDLRRTAIKQPLLSMVLDPKNKDIKLPLIVEVNDGYYAGNATAVQMVAAFVKSLAGGRPPVDRQRYEALNG